MTNQYLTIKKSSIHRRGVFARKDIPKCTFIVEYKGRKVTKEEGTRIEKKSLRKGRTYIFELDSKHDIDGDVQYNEARYINHSCGPNCKIIHKKGHIWIVAKRNIFRGEELSYNYGFDFEDYRKQICRCSSKKCVGYILDEEYWPKLKKAVS